MQTFSKVATTLRVIRRLSTYNQNARRYTFLATSAQPQGHRSQATSAIENASSAKAESNALCKISPSKLPFPQPITIFNLTAFDNVAALNLFFLGNNPSNVVVYSSLNNSPNIASSSNDFCTPNMMYRNYSTQKCDTTSGEKKTNPHIVCVAKDGKGCVSPGNSDLPVYDPANASAAKGESASSADSNDDGGCCCPKSPTQFSKNPFEDFQLLSCDAYKKAIRKASKNKQELEANDCNVSIAPCSSLAEAQVKAAVDCGAETEVEAQCGAETEAEIDCGAESEVEVACGAQQAHAVIECGAPAHAVIECGAPAHAAIECGAESHAEVECGAQTEAESDLEYDDHHVEDVNPTVVYACGNGVSNVPAIAAVAPENKSAASEMMFAKDGCKDDPCKEPPPKCVDPCDELMKKKPEASTPPKRKRNQMPTGCVSPKCQKQPSKPGSGGCRNIHHRPLVINGTQYASVRCYSSKGCKKDGDEKIKKMEEALKKQEEDLKKMCEDQKKAEEDAKKKEEDAKKKEAEAKKGCDDLKKKEDECKKAADDAKKKEEDCKKCIDDLKKKSEDAKKCAEETKKAAEEAKKKAEELKKAVEDGKKCLEEAKKDLEDAKKCNEAKKVLDECKNKKKGKDGGCGGGDKKDSPCKDKDKKSPCSSSKPSKPSCGDKKGFATFASAEPLTLDTSNIVKRHFGTFKIDNGLTIKNFGFGFDHRFFSSKNESSGGKCGQTVMPKNRKKDPNARPKDGLTTGCYEDTAEGGCQKPPKKKESLCDKHTGKDPFPGGCKNKENKKFPSVYKLLNSKHSEEEKIFYQQLNINRAFSSNSYNQQKPLKDCDSGKAMSSPGIENCNEVIRINTSGYIEKIQTPIPQFSDYDVLIRTMDVAISGSDIHIFENGNSSCSGITLGHDASGIIDKVGKSIINLRPGDRVAVESGLSCGICEFCKKGAYNMCMQLIYNGFLMKYQVHPADLCHKIPDTLSLAEASLTHTLALGCQAAAKASITPSTNVLVIGSSPTAVASALSARAIGAKHVVLLCQMHDALESLHDHFDFDYVHDEPSLSFSEVLESIFCAFTDWPEVVINCAINERNMNIAVMTLRPCGICVLTECDTEGVSFNALDVLMKNIRIIPSFRSTNMFPTAIHLMESGKAPMAEMISAVYSWQSMERAFRTAQEESNNGYRKVIIQCSEEDYYKYYKSSKT